MIITISGLPGSGTTTAAYILAEQLDVTVRSAGEEFRSMAKQRNVSLADFGKMAEADDNIDRELDKRMIIHAKSIEKGILEGRLVGLLCHMEKIPALKIWLEAAPKTRAERISGRENEGLKESTKKMLEREKSESARYKEFYGLDLYDTSIYNLVIDSGIHSPEEIVKKIMEAM